MTEEQIAKALDGKFFRGPSNFYQNPIGVKDQAEPDEAPKGVAPAKVDPDRAMRMLSMLESTREQIEKECEASEVKWRVPISICIESVCTAHSVSRRELMDHASVGARSKRLVDARYHAAWLIRAIRPDARLTLISTQLNYKDHTTVVYGIKRFEASKMKFIPEIATSLQIIREKTGDNTICLP